jgi:molybdopterin molybdotransferase
MLSFEEARAQLLSSARDVGTERASIARPGGVVLGDAAGRILRADVLARTSLPRFDASAMDGYAISTDDLPAEDDFFPTKDQFSLRVVGESRAGGDSGVLDARTACRIFTGAALPVRANAVIMQENVRRVDDGIFFDTRPKPWQHVRRLGEDMKLGDKALSVGTRLSAGALALAAMLDATELTVSKRPRVTILSTGDELRPAGSAEAAHGSIPESNSPAVSALARAAGANVTIAPIVRDDPTEIERAIAAALSECDVLVTIGGVSVGDHDHVRPALERAGVSLDFWKVAIKPGKPLVVGRSDRAHVLGLPGNPASAMVTFALFGVPLLRAMQQDASPLPFVIPATLAAPRPRVKERLEVARVTLALEGDALVATVAQNQASGAATTLAHSDGVMMLAAGEGTAPAGAPVKIIRWSDV